MPASSTVSVLPPTTATAPPRPAEFPRVRSISSSFRLAPPCTTNSRVRSRPSSVTNGPAFEPGDPSIISRPETEIARSTFTTPGPPPPSVSSDASNWIVSAAVDDPPTATSLKARSMFAAMTASRRLTTPSRAITSSPVVTVKVVSSARSSSVSAAAGTGAAPAGAWRRARRAVSNPRRSVSNPRRSGAVGRVMGGGSWGTRRAGRTGAAAGRTGLRAGLPAESRRPAEYPHSPRTPDRSGSIRPFSPGTRPAVDGHAASRGRPRPAAEPGGPPVPPGTTGARGRRPGDRVAADQVPFDSRRPRTDVGRRAGPVGAGFQPAPRERGERVAVEG